MSDRPTFALPLALARPAVPPAAALIAFIALALLAWALLGGASAFVHVLAAPWAEEAVLRLAIQEPLLERMGGAHPGERAVLSSACAACVFASAHVLLRPDALSAATCVPAFAIGLVFARGRLLMPCVLLHSLFNLAWFAAIGPWFVSISN